MATNRDTQNVTALRTVIDNSTTEGPVQRFLEKHPSLLVGPHHPEGNAVVSQLKLGSDFTADFAYVYRDSTGDYVRLIEIERPNIEIFTKGGEFGQSFNHAFQQVLDWKPWCEQNQQYLAQTFIDLIGAPSPRGLTPRCVLIAGRRSETLGPVRASRFKSRTGASNLPPGIEIRTYDGFLSNLARLRPLSGAKPITCVSYQQRGFVPKSSTQGP